MSFAPYDVSRAELAALFNTGGLGDRVRASKKAVEEEMKKRFGKDCFKPVKGRKQQKSSWGS